MPRRRVPFGRAAIARIDVRISPCHQAEFDRTARSDLLRHPVMRQERGELDAAAIGAAHRDSDMIPVDRPCRDRTPTGAGGFKEGADDLATAVPVVDGRTVDGPAHRTAVTDTGQVNSEPG